MGDIGVGLAGHDGDALEGIVGIAGHQALRIGLGFPAAAAPGGFGEGVVGLPGGGDAAKVIKGIDGPGNAGVC